MEKALEEIEHQATVAQRRKNGKKPRKAKAGTIDRRKAEQMAADLEEHDSRIVGGRLRG